MAWMWPYMPFTHTINFLRETVGGTNWEIIIRNILNLLAFVLLCFILAILLKKALSKVVALNSGQGEIE